MAASGWLCAVVLLVCVLAGGASARRCDLPTSKLPAAGACKENCDPDHTELAITADNEGTAVTCPNQAHKCCASKLRRNPCELLVVAAEGGGRASAPKLACKHTCDLAAEEKVPNADLIKLCARNEQCCRKLPKCRDALGRERVCVNGQCAGTNFPVAITNPQAACENPAHVCCTALVKDSADKSFNTAKTTKPNGDATEHLVKDYKYPGDIPTSKRCFEVAASLSGLLPSGDNICMYGVAEIGGRMYYSTSRDECAGPSPAAVNLYGEEVQVTKVVRTGTMRNIRANDELSVDSEHDSTWSCAGPQLLLYAKETYQDITCLVEMYKSHTNARIKPRRVVESCERCQSRMPVLKDMTWHEIEGLKPNTQAQALTPRPRS